MEFLTDNISSSILKSRTCLSKCQETGKCNIVFKTIQKVQNAISSKTTLPILSNILLEAGKDSVKITATDLDIGICATIPVKASQEGAITIPARKFFDIVKALPEESEINVSIKKGNSINIKSGKAQFRILGLSKDEFPQLPLFKDRDSITIPQALLKEMIHSLLV